MQNSEIGLKIARARKAAGLTQAALAARVGTTQSAIARAEIGRALPRLDLLQRITDATGMPIEIRLEPTKTRSTTAERRARVRRALGDYRFNPWDRSPTAAEARSLAADGLTREYFDLLRQATVKEENEGREFKSALAILVSRFEEIDHAYVTERIREAIDEGGIVGPVMKRLHSRLLRRARATLT